MSDDASVARQNLEAIQRQAVGGREADRLAALAARAELNATRAAEDAAYAAAMTRCQYSDLAREQAIIDVEAQRREQDELRAALAWKRAQQQ